MKHNWEYKQLGDVCNILMGQSPSSDSYNDESKGLPFFQGCSDFGKIHPSVTKFCSEPIRIAAENDILFSVRAPIGTMNIANLPCCIGRGLCSFRIHDPNLQKYLFYALNVTKPKIIEKGTGSTFKAVNKDVLHKHIIPVPPLNVQEQIVAELDKINETIEDCRELLRNLDDLAQSLFYDFFGDPISNPKKWQIKKIKEIGKIITGSTPSTKVEDYYNSHDICFVKPGDIDNSISYISDTKDYISNFAFDSCCRKLPMGTVVVTCIGIIGKVGVLKVEASCNQQINAVIPFDAINNIYLAYILKEYAPLFTDAATGPVVKILNKSSFSEFSIPVPPLEIQEKFAERIERIEAQKKVVESAIAELQTLLDSRMDYWFN